MYKNCVNQHTQGLHKEESCIIYKTLSSIKSIIFPRIVSKNHNIHRVLQKFSLEQHVNQFKNTCYLCDSVLRLFKSRCRTTILTKGMFLFLHDSICQNQSIKFITQNHINISIVKKPSQIYYVLFLGENLYIIYCDYVCSRISFFFYSIDINIFNHCLKVLSANLQIYIITPRPL